MWIILQNGAKQIQKICTKVQIISACIDLCVNYNIDMLMDMS